MLKAHAHEIKHKSNHLTIAPEQKKKKPRKKKWKEYRDDEIFVDSVEEDTYGFFFLSPFPPISSM